MLSINRISDTENNINESFIIAMSIRFENPLVILLKV